MAWHASQSKGMESPHIVA